jgi:hypothetical protein
LNILAARINAFSDSKNMDRKDRTIRVGRLQDQGKDDDLSSTTTPEERMEMMWQLAKDGYEMLGVQTDESEFPRHVDGVIRGKR